MNFSRFMLNARLGPIWARSCQRTMSSRCLNKVSLIGYVGSEPVIKGTVDHPVVLFNLATNSGIKTDWHRISVFQPGLRALVENSVKTGTRLYVDGRLTYGEIVDSQGTVQKLTSVIANEIIFLSPKQAVTENTDEGSDDNAELGRSSS